MKKKHEKKINRIIHLRLQKEDQRGQNVNNQNLKKRGREVERRKQVDGLIESVKEKKSFFPLQ